MNTIKYVEIKKYHPALFPIDSVQILRFMKEKTFEELTEDKFLKTFLQSIEVIKEVTYFYILSETQMLRNHIQKSDFTSQKF